MSVGCAVSQHVRMRQCSTVELSLGYAYILYAESAHPLYLLLHVRMLSDIATTACHFFVGLCTLCTVRTWCSMLALYYDERSLLTFQSVIVVTSCCLWLDMVSILPCTLNRTLLVPSSQNTVQMLSFGRSEGQSNVCTQRYDLRFFWWIFSTFKRLLRRPRTAGPTIAHE